MGIELEQFFVSKILWLDGGESDAQNLLSNALAHSAETSGHVYYAYKTHVFCFSFF